MIANDNCYSKTGTGISAKNMDTIFSQPSNLHQATSS